MTHALIDRQISEHRIVAGLLTADRLPHDRARRRAVPAVKSLLPITWGGAVPRVISYDWHYVLCRKPYWHSIIDNSDYPLQKILGRHLYALFTDESWGPRMSFSPTKFSTRTTRIQSSLPAAHGATSSTAATSTQRILGPCRSFRKPQCALHIR